MDELEQPGRAHAAADAHGDDAELCLPPPPLQEKVAGHARSRHSVGMADRNCAAVNVQLLMRNSDAFHAVEDLARESLVQFPQIDVVGFQAVAFEQAWHGIDWSDPHFVRLAACDCEAAENS